MSNTTEGLANKEIATRNAQDYMSDVGYRNTKTQDERMRGLRADHYESNRKKRHQLEEELFVKDLKGQRLSFIREYLLAHAVPVSTAVHVWEDLEEEFKRARVS